MQDQESPVARGGYDPNRLLDALISKMELKNDAALARALEIPPPLLSKIRHRKTSVSAPVLIRMHEVSGLSIRELRDLMGDRRKKYRVSNTYTLPKAEDMLEQEGNS